MAEHHDPNSGLWQALIAGVTGGGLLKAWEVFQAWRRARIREQVEVKRLELDDEQEDRKTARELRDELRQDLRELRGEVGTLRERVAVLEGEVRNRDHVIAEQEKTLAAQEHALKTAALNESNLKARVLDLERTVNTRTQERDDLISELAAERRKRG